MQSAAKISLLCIGMQAIMDSYSCLVHLITAVLMGAFQREHSLTHSLTPLSFKAGLTR